MKKSLLFAACATLFATSFVAKADTKITNLTASTSVSRGVEASSWRAQKFKTDASAASFTLDSVVLNLGAPWDTSGNFFVKIYGATGSDGAWLPNNASVLGALTGEVNPAVAAQYTYTASGITLQADTNYWIVAGVSSGVGGYTWFDTTNLTPEGTWTITPTNTKAFSGTSGSSWSNGDGNPYMFAVNATAAVPARSAMASKNSPRAPTSLGTPSFPKAHATNCVPDTLLILGD